MMAFLTLYGAPIVVAALVWWGGTGIILCAAAVGERRKAVAAALATIVALAAFGAVLATADDPSIVGAYVAFAASIAIWGWHELMFLTGRITGSRRAPCPPNARPWVRFWCATATVIHHEVALFVTMIGLYLALLDAANLVAAHVFAILWAMRVSAKLNLFLGVPMRADALLPDALAHLASYFRNRPMNPLFPVSVTVGALGVGFLVAEAATAATAFDAVAATLLAVLLALAVLEHWFMVVDLGDAALWRWMLPADDPRRADPAAIDGAPAERPWPTPKHAPKHADETDADRLNETLDQTIDMRRIADGWRDASTIMRRAARNAAPTWLRRRPSGPRAAASRSQAAPNGRATAIGS